MLECLLCNQLFVRKQSIRDILWCRSKVTAVCAACRESFQLISEQHCESCYKEGESPCCRDCQAWKELGLAVSHRASYQYNTAMADYMSRYKFQGDYLLRKVFAERLKEDLSVYVGYTIVPIPLGPQRFKERGFNQVEGLLEAACIPYQCLLGKEDSQKQSSKSRKERLQASQVFYIQEKEVVPEKIVLVDDVYTTGMTLQLAKKMLMKNGAKQVKTFSLAR